MTESGQIGDRVEIEALRAEFADAVMMGDYDRLASLFTDDGAVRIPHINAHAIGRDQIRAGVERMQRQWECFVQMTHPGAIVLDGDTASRLASQLRHLPRPLSARRGRLEVLRAPL